MLSHPPVPISEFAAHVARLKAGDAALFAAEYESIDPGQQFTWESSSLDANKPRNRYANVIAYDHSRVRLQPLDGVASSDYINANYLDGYCRSNAYIATQARAVTPPTIGWLGSRVVSVLDSGAESPGFHSQPRRCRVTVLGKLFTPIVPLFTKQRKR